MEDAGSNNLYHEKVVLHHFKDEEEDLLYVVGGFGHTAPSSPQPGALYSKYHPGVNTNEQHTFSLTTRECCFSSAPNLVIMQ